MLSQPYVVSIGWEKPGQLHANGIAITSLLTDLKGLEAAFANAAEAVTPAVVRIEATSTRQVATGFGNL